MTDRDFDLDDTYGRRDTSYRGFPQFCKDLSRRYCSSEIVGRDPSQFLSQRKHVNTHPSPSASTRRRLRSCSPSLRCQQKQNQPQNLGHDRRAHPSGVQLRSWWSPTNRIRGGVEVHRRDQTVELGRRFGTRGKDKTWVFIVTGGGDHLGSCPSLSQHPRSSERV